MGGAGPPYLADIICEQPLPIYITYFQSYLHVDLTLHLMFVQIGPTVTLCFSGQKKPKNQITNLFHIVLNKANSTKNSFHKKLPKAIKDRGGGGVQVIYDRVQRFDKYIYMASLRA